MTELIILSSTLIMKGVNTLEKELKLGVMTDKELAEWCDKNLDGFKKNRSRWLKTQFSKYAEYTLAGRGKINITKIINPVYSASGKKEVATKFDEFWGNGTDRIDTNANCWRKMRNSMIAQLSDSTGQNYVGQIKRQDYGIAAHKNQRNGEKGYCRYVFCKVIDGNGYFFDEEELRIKKELEQKYLCSHAKYAYMQQALYEDYKQGGLTKEEYIEALMETVEYDYDWAKFKEAFEQAIGYTVDFKTLLIDDEVIPSIEFDF